MLRVVVVVAVVVVVVVVVVDGDVGGGGGVMVRQAEGPRRRIMHIGLAALLYLTVRGVFCVFRWAWESIDGDW